MKLSPYPILLLGGAKRVSISQQIAKAFRDRGFEARFFSYEMEKHVPVATIGEVMIGKRWKDPEVYADLAQVSEDNGIRMIIPFLDGAVAVAAEMTVRYPGLKLFVPGTSAENAERFFDKGAAAELFAKLELPIPVTWHPGEEPRFPLIAKPRHGSASKGIVILRDKADLQRLARAEEYLIQEFIEEREEISIDCYCSLTSGKPLVVSPRKRIETLGGEAVRSVTIGDEDVKSLASKILVATGLRGASTIQLIRDLREPKRLLIMEINPRLGGGVVCSTGAGADIPGCIADEALGLEAKVSEAQPGTEMCRYFQEVIFRP